MLAPQARSAPTQRVSTRPPVARPIAPAESARTLPEELRSTPSLTGRFRLLRLHADRICAAPADAVRDILDAFPEGWARRRALQALFRAGVPESREAALALVRELERPTDRRWCLRMLGGQV